jgi:hypothetical protein
MDLQISINGENEDILISLLEETRDLINESGLYRWTFTEPSTNLSDQLVITSRLEIIDGFPQFSETSLINNIRKILRGTNVIDFDEGNLTPGVSSNEKLATELRIKEILKNIKNFRLHILLLLKTQVRSWIILLHHFIFLWELQLFLFSCFWHFSLIPLLSL